MKYNVLVFPGGTEIGLEIYKSLRHCKEVQLFSAASHVSNHAPYVFKNHFVIPSIFDPSWIDDLNKVIIENKIDFVFPAFDDVIIALTENTEKIKTRIVCSPVDTCIITRSKLQTYILLQDIIPVPILYRRIENVQTYPIFLKPDKGQGSHGIQFIENRTQLRPFLKDIRSSKLIAMEYLPGEEYTIDCFSDRGKGLLFCSGRQRLRTKNGISMNSKTVQEDVFMDYAKAISSRLTFYGAWFFQVKKNKQGIFKLMEIAPRIAGTMALHRVKGINFPLLSIYEQERIPIEILTHSIDAEVDRALINRYRHNIQYSVVYIDLDDTLIIGDKVNTVLIQFLYQCVNSGRKIILLTRHAHNIRETLARYRLQSIFDEIIQIEKTAKKSDYIVQNNAILIDDSFSERNDVSKTLHIPTFDSSMLELLLDERV
jgi:carbamoylphosphate synthase large subunit